ncbi:MAG: hypothetical protein R2695_01350 [Acidimicrobiales bacterium]
MTGFALVILAAASAISRTVSLLHRGGTTQGGRRDGDLGGSRDAGVIATAPQGAEGAAIVAVALAVKWGLAAGAGDVRPTSDQAVGRRGRAGDRSRRFDSLEQPGRRYLAAVPRRERPPLLHRLSPERTLLFVAVAALLVATTNAIVRIVLDLVIDQGHRRRASEAVA